jgi:hypothetical protein
MKLTDSGGGNYEQAPVGSHIARCIRMIDIGTQRNEFQGQANFKRQIILFWELPTELMTTPEHEGKPFMVSKFYTASLNEKATLRKDLANWRGRDFTEQELLGFDSKNLLDKGCMLSVIHNDKNKARVSGVMALPKNMQLPARINDLLYFSLERSDFNQAVFDSLSDGIKKMIEISPEYISIKNGSQPDDSRASMADMDDDIPF